MLWICEDVSYRSVVVVSSLSMFKSVKEGISFDKSGSLPLPAPTGLSSLGMSVSLYCFLFFLSA